MLFSPLSFSAVDADVDVVDDGDADGGLCPRLLIRSLKNRSPAGVSFESVTPSCFFQTRQSSPLPCFTRGKDNGVKENIPQASPSPPPPHHPSPSPASDVPNRPPPSFSAATPFSSAV